MISFPVSKSYKFIFDRSKRLLILNLQYIRAGLVLSCGVAGAIIFVSFYWKKNKKSSNDKMHRFRSNSTPELVNPCWLKVGKVKELYYYPLKSGRGKEVTECEFTQFGISITNDSHLTLRDR